MDSFEKYEKADVMSEIFAETEPLLQNGIPKAHLIAREVSSYGMQIVNKNWR